jgi:hypothetical protein
MEGLQTASDIRRGQVISFNDGGQWTDPAQVIHVQHNRLCGRAADGRTVRGVVVLLSGRKVAALDDDTIVRLQKEPAHA